MRQVLAVLLVGAALAIAAWLLWPRPPSTDEDLIRQAIADIARSASAKDVGGILEHVSERYQGEGGGRQELKGYLLSYLLRSDWVSAVPTRVEIRRREADVFDVSLVVLLARSPVRSAEEIQVEGLAGSHLLETKFAREPDGWRVFAATRREAAVGDWFR